MGTQDLLGYKGQEVTMVLKVLQDLRVPKENQVQLDQRDQKERKETRETEAQQAQRGHQGHMQH